MPVPSFPNYVLQMTGEAYGSVTDLKMESDLFKTTYGVRELDDILEDIDRINEELNAAV
jgi:hypothetical protein